MIDREQLEAKARQLEDAIGQTQKAVKSGAMMVVIGVGAAVAVAYFLGRRKGSARSARIEIRKLK
jgi:hypothetical protein